MKIVLILLITSLGNSAPQLMVSSFQNADTCQKELKMWKSYEDKSMSIDGKCITVVSVSIGF